MNKEEILELIKSKPHISIYEDLFTKNMFGEVVRKQGTDIAIDENEMVSVITTVAANSFLDSITTANHDVFKTISKTGKAWKETADDFAMRTPFKENSIFHSSYDEKKKEKEKEVEEKKKEEEKRKILANVFNSENEIDEDAYERYIRKVLHKIRSFKIQKRKVDIRMNIYVYQVLNFELNGKNLARIIMQVKNNGYTNIDVTKIKDIESTKTNISQFYTGFIIDDKLGFYFESADDKNFTLNYINGKGIDNFIPAFSKFDLKTIQFEIKQRISNPGLINQSGTPLCGVAVVCNLVAKHYKLEFQYLIEDLFYYAEAFFGKTNYLIKPRNSLVAQNYRIDTKSKAYPKDYKGVTMPQADYVLLSSIKTSENKVLSYDGLWQLGGVSLPSDIVGLLTKFLNSVEVEDKTSLIGRDLEEMLLLIEMDKNYTKGHECIMFINSNMLSNELNGEFPNHWISFKGGLKHNFDKKEIKFKLFTWGEGDGKFYTISQDVFKKHFYGYIKVKVK